MDWMNDRCPTKNKKALNNSLLKSVQWIARCLKQILFRCIYALCRTILMHVHAIVYGHHFNTFGHERNSHRFAYIFKSVFVILLCFIFISENLVHLRPIHSKSSLGNGLGTYKPQQQAITWFIDEPLSRRLFVQLRRNVLMRLPQRICIGCIYIPACWCLCSKYIQTNDNSVQRCMFKILTHQSP